LLLPIKTTDAPFAAVNLITPNPPAVAVNERVPFSLLLPLPGKT
jgi:hypothetical protein